MSIYKEEREDMSLKSEPIGPIPEETMRIAKAAFPKGTRFMKMRDELGTLYHDEMFADLFSATGQPALAPWRLALVTIMHFAEELPDRQAADAVRSRIDWKYALGLELSESGFDFSALSEFRSRLIEGHAESLLFETLLLSLRQRGLLKAGGQQRTDATHVLAAVRVINRAVCVGETLRATLNSLAEVVPEWLSFFAPEEWYQRYAHRIEEYRRAFREREASCCSRNHRSRWIWLAGCDFYNARLELVASSPSGRNAPPCLGATVRADRRANALPF